jgi:hypothetical protein
MRVAMMTGLVVLVLSACQGVVVPVPGVVGAGAGGVAMRGQFPDGRLDLADGTRWVVQPAGQSATLRWRGGDGVRVVRSGHPVWPVLLIHPRSGTKALARPGGRVG